jgi:hypothetical protein
MKRINGAVTAQQSLTGSLQYYTLYASSPLSVSDPDPNPPENQELTRLLNIQTTGEIKDQSQKNFEIIFQAIGLRSVPSIMNDPEAVSDLSVAGAPTLTGEGFVWKFVTSQEKIFYDFSNDNPVGLLVSDLDGLVIDSGVQLVTTGGSINVEFTSMDKL